MVFIGKYLTHKVFLAKIPAVLQSFNDIHLRKKVFFV
jgi:hypothetical protein